ncbi:MAG: hypothetical protein AAFS03_08595 [Pseudomonadota bacterium]
MSLDVLIYAVIAAAALVLLVRLFGVDRAWSAVGEMWRMFTRGMKCFAPLVMMTMVLAGCFASFSPVTGEKRIEIRHNALAAIRAYQALHPDPRQLSETGQARLAASCAAGHIFIGSLSADAADAVQAYCATAMEVTGPQPTIGATVTIPLGRPD